MSEEIAVVEPQYTPSSKQQIVRDTAVTIGTRAFQFSSIFIKSIIVARALGPEGSGIYKLIIIMYELLVAYGRLGVGESIVYYAGRKPGLLEKYVGNILTLALIASGLMLGLIAALYGVLVKSFFQGVPLLPMVIMLAMLPLGLLITYLVSVLQSQRKLIQFNIIQGFVSLTHLIAMFVALFVFHAGVMGAVLATTISVILPAGLALYRVSRFTRIRPQWDWATVKELISFGLKSHTQFVMNATIDKMDIPIMNLYLSPAAVGMVAMSLVGRTLNLPTAVSTALYPHMVASDSPEQMDRITEGACRNLMAMVSVIAIAGAIVGKPVITFLYGPAFREAYAPFLLLLLAMIPQGSYQVLNRNFASRGKPLMGAIPTGIAIIVNMVGDFVLIPRLGIIGAGAATLAGAVCLILSGVFIYTRLSGRPWWKAVIIQPSDLTLYKQLVERAGQRLRRMTVQRSPVPTK
jgi:O-antigen/teichoic acid export membrane protein